MLHLIVQISIQINYVHSTFNDNVNYFVGKQDLKDVLRVSQCNLLLVYPYIQVFCILIHILGIF